MVSSQKHNTQQARRMDLLCKLERVRNEEETIDVGDVVKRTEEYSIRLKNLRTGLKAVQV